MYPYHLLFHTHLLHNIMHFWNLINAVLCYQLLCVDRSITKPMYSLFNVYAKAIRQRHLASFLCMDRDQALIFSFLRLTLGYASQNEPHSVCKSPIVCCISSFSVWNLSRETNPSIFKFCMKLGQLLWKKEMAIFSGNRLDMS